MNKVINWFFILLVIALVAATSALIGYTAAEWRYMKVLEKYQDRCFKEKRTIYGINYFYFSYKGRHYFVTNIADLDKRNKWIRMR